MLRSLAAATLILCASAGAAAAQIPFVILGGYFGTQALGVEAGAGIGPVVLAFRTDGFPWASQVSQTLLLRVTPFHSGLQGPYAAVGWAEVHCPAVTLGGDETGCSGESVAVLALDAGLGVAASRRLYLFLEGGFWVSDSPVVPDWRFSAGGRVHFAPRVPAPAPE